MKLISLGQGPGSFLWKSVAKYLFSQAVARESVDRLEINHFNVYVILLCCIFVLQDGEHHFPEKRVALVQFII